METGTSTAATHTVDMSAELANMVHHLSAMVRTVRKFNPATGRGVCADALEKHLQGLTPEALGLPAQWVDHAARIEAKAAAEHAAETAAEGIRRTA